MPALDRLAVIHHYTAAWAETERDQQRTHLAHCWTSDSTYEDPQTPAVRGVEALLDVIAGFHQALPGARLPLNSAVEEYHQVGRFHWLLKQADGSTSYGTDFVEFDDHNHLVRVVGFFSHLARWQK